MRYRTDAARCQVTFLAAWEAMHCVWRQASFLAAAARRRVKSAAQARANWARQREREMRQVTFLVATRASSRDVHLAGESESGVAVEAGEAHASMGTAVAETAPGDLPGARAGHRASSIFPSDVVGGPLGWLQIAPHTRYHVAVAAPVVMPVSHRDKRQKAVIRTAQGLRVTNACDQILREPNWLAELPEGAAYVCRTCSHRML